MIKYKEPKNNLKYPMNIYNKLFNKDRQNIDISPEQTLNLVKSIQRESMLNKAKEINLFNERNNNKIGCTYDNTNNTAISDFNKDKIIINNIDIQKNNFCNMNCLKKNSNDLINKNIKFNNNKMEKCMDIFEKFQIKNKDKYAHIFNVHVDNKKCSNNADYFKRTHLYKFNNILSNNNINNTLNIHNIEYNKCNNIKKEGENNILDNVPNDVMKISKKKEKMKNLN